MWRIARWCIARRCIAGVCLLTDRVLIEGVHALHDGNRQARTKRLAVGGDV